MRMPRRSLRLLRNLGVRHGGPERIFNYGVRIRSSQRSFWFSSTLLREFSFSDSTLNCQIEYLLLSALRFFAQATPYHHALGTAAPHPKYLLLSALRFSAQAAPYHHALGAPRRIQRIYCFPHCVFSLRLLFTCKNYHALRENRFGRQIVAITIIGMGRMSLGGRPIAHAFVFAARKHGVPTVLWS